MIAHKINCTNTEEFTYFDPNIIDTLHLTDNNKPFPPDYYARYKLLLGSLDDYDSSSNDENISVDNDNTSFEDENNFTQESEYEYRNDLLLFDAVASILCPFRLFVNDIEVTNGKITFFIEGGPPVIIEDKFLMNTFRTDNEASCQNTYESFWGKKSILKHHFKHVYPHNCSYYWSNEVESCYTNIIAEIIHDGVTTFVIDDLGDSAANVEHLDFPDGIYNMDGVKIAKNWADLHKRNPDLKNDNFIDDDDIPF